MKPTRAEKLTMYDVRIMWCNTIFFGLPLFIYLICNFNGHPSLLTCIVLGIFTVVGGFASYRTIGKWHRAFLWFYFIHLIVFPFLYSYIQINFPDNFLINEKVSAAEVINSHQKVKEIYEPQKLVFSNFLINKMLNSKSFIARSVSKVQQAPLVVDSIVLSIVFEDRELDVRRNIIFSNLKGAQLVQLYSPYSGKDDDLQVDVYLKKLLRINYDLLKRYNQEVVTIKQKKFWDFNSIFPYALNIFNTENIRAQSRFANIFLALHQLIFLILITLLCASLYDNFKGDAIKKKSRNRRYSYISRKLVKFKAKL